LAKCSGGHISWAPVARPSRLSAAASELPSPVLRSSSPLCSDGQDYQSHLYPHPTDGSVLLVVRIDLRFDRPAATRTSRTNWQDALLSAILVRFPSDLLLILRFALRHRLPYRFFRSPPPRPSSGALSPLGPRWNAPMVATPSLTVLTSLIDPSSLAPSLVLSGRRLVALYSALPTPSACAR